MRGKREGKILLGKYTYLAVLKSDVRQCSASWKTSHLFSKSGLEITSLFLSVGVCKARLNPTPVCKLM